MLNKLINIKRLSVLTRFNGFSSNRQMLLSIPEYSSACNDMKFERNVSNAVISLKRVHEILIHSLGQTSSLTAHCSLLLAHALTLQGDNQQSEDIYKVYSQSSDFTQSVVALQCLARLKLSTGHIVDSLQYANQSLAILENNSHLDLRLFHASHSLIGLSHLFLISSPTEFSQDEDTEHSLQLSARWSQSLLCELISLNNLGGFAWLRFKGRQEWRHRQFLCDKIITSNSETDRRDVRSGSEKSALEALEYWNDAINHAMKEDSDSSDTDSPASSICGVSTTSDSNNSNSGNLSTLELRLQDVSVLLITCMLLSRV